MTAGEAVVGAVVLLLSAVPFLAGGAARTGCEAALEAQAQLAEERRRQLRGGSDDDPLQVDFEKVVKACFQQDVMPRLKAAEGDDNQIPAAFESLFSWGRGAQLMGFGDEDFAAEWNTAYASLTTAFKNGYGKALARCAKQPNAAAAERLTELYTGSALVADSDALFPNFRDDVEKCLRGPSYLVTLRQNTTWSKGGTMGEITYTAVLRPQPKDPEELEGTGSYSGFIVSSSNCNAQTGEWFQPHVRLPLRGKLEAEAMTGDRSDIGEAANGIQVILGTVDWPYKPMFADARDAVATGEDREAVAGMGTAVTEFIPLTDPVTTHRTSETRDGGICTGTITETTELRIERLGRR